MYTCIYVYGVCSRGCSACKEEEEDTWVVFKQENKGKACGYRNVKRRENTKRKAKSKWREGRKGQGNKSRMIIWKRTKIL